jgi:hypothetical protein
MTAQRNFCLGNSPLTVKAAANSNSGRPSKGSNWLTIHPFPEFANPQRAVAQTKIP